MEEIPKTESLKADEPDKGNFNFILENGLWHPNPTDILAVFEKLQQCNGGPLPLSWKCPGRRAPEKNETQENQSSDRVDRSEADSKEEKLRAPEVSAFDFDEFGADMNSRLTPRSTPGLARTPRTEKRVAKMDNIMDSLFKQHLQRTAEKEAKRKASGTPTGRSRPFMSQRPKPTVSRQLNALGSDISESPANASASDVALNKGTSASDVALNKGTSASDVALNKGTSANDGALNNETSNALTSTDTRMASNGSFVTSSSLSSPTQLATTVVTLDAGDTTTALLPIGDTNTTLLIDNTNSGLPPTDDTTSTPLSTGDIKNTPLPSGDTNNALPPTGDTKSTSPPSSDSNSALPPLEAATSVPQSVASTSPPPSQCTATVTHITTSVSHISASGSNITISPESSCPQSSSPPVLATVSPGDNGATPTALSTEPKPQELVTNQSGAAITPSPDQVNQEPALSKLNLIETAAPAERMEEG